MRTDLPQVLADARTACAEKWNAVMATTPRTPERRRAVRTYLAANAARADIEAALRASRDEV
jgi:hypothetical protein